MSMTDERTSVAEQMAIAVLRGDMAAARALADILSEEVRQSGVRLPSVTKLTVDANRLRVVVFFPATVDGYPITLDAGGTTAAVQGWLAEGSAPLILQGAERIELYEMPEPAEVDDIDL